MIFHNLYNKEDLIEEANKATFYGYPVSSFNKDELLIFIGFLIKESYKEKNRSLKYLERINELTTKR